MKKASVFSILTICFIVVFFMGNSFANPVNENGQDWKIKSESKIDDNPSLVHFTWEMLRPPYGDLEKIRLHRVVQNNKQHPIPGQHKDKVIFILPGTWNAGGWSKITDPNVNTMLFLALNEYDVYTMDYRTVNIPDMDYDQFDQQGKDITPTTDWNFGVFREDIKACVEKIKKESRAKRIFLGGFSRGGILMYIYASKYQDDLKGLISFDGGIKDAPPMGVPMDEATYNAIVELFKSGQLIDPHTNELMPWLFDLSQIEQAPYDTFKLAGVLPYARQMAGGPLPEGFETVSDYVADYLYHLMDFVGLGEGLFANYYGGYIQRDVLVTTLDEFCRYSPHIQTLEESQMAAYDDVPYLDYDDNDIYLPTIAFLSNLFCPYGYCLIDPSPNMSKSSDVTINYLQGFGHMDVMFGTYSLEHVKTPLLEWLNNHVN